MFTINIYNFNDLIYKILNLQEVDPCKRWKGIWRWWADDMLECCYSLEYVKIIIIIYYFNTKITNIYLIMRIKINIFKYFK